MILGLLPVVGEFDGAVVVLGEGNGDGGNERDALVGGSKEYVELDTAVGDGLRIYASEPGEGGAVVVEISYV